MTDDLIEQAQALVAGAIDDHVRGDHDPESYVSSPDDWTGEATAAVTALAAAGLLHNPTSETPDYRGQVLKALAETDSAWGEETGDGDANPAYLDTLTESVVYLRDAEVARLRAELAEAQASVTFWQKQAELWAAKCDRLEDQRDRLSLMLRGMARRAGAQRRGRRQNRLRWLAVLGERTRLQARIDAALQTARVWDDLSKDNARRLNVNYANAHRDTLRHVAGVIREQLTEDVGGGSARNAAEFRQHAQHGDSSMDPNCAYCPPVDEGSGAAGGRSTPVRVRRLKSCVESWPECQEGECNPSCCRFPKSCSCTVYDDEHVTEDDLEPDLAGGNEC